MKDQKNFELINLKIEFKNKLLNNVQLKIIKPMIDSTFNALY